MLAEGELAQPPVTSALPGEAGILSEKAKERSLAFPPEPQILSSISSQNLFGN